MENAPLLYPKINIETRQDLKELLFDLDLWRPYIDYVNTKHNLKIDPQHYTTIPRGLEGTTPVFLLARKYAVKFYIPIPGNESSGPCNGEQVYRTELESFALLNQCPETINVPRIANHGLILDNRPAKDEYLFYVTTVFMDGITFEEVAPSFTDEEFHHFARQLGKTVAQFHGVSPKIKREELQSEWNSFIHERHRHVGATLIEKSVPQHLVDKVHEYLPKNFQAWVDKATSAFIHCDLHKSHIFIKKIEGKWEITGILDWGDSRYGDPYYELATVHADLFECKPALLKSFLEGYGTYSNSFQTTDFEYRSMVNFILYEFNHWKHPTKPKGIFHFRPEYEKFQSWEELAAGLWHVPQ